MIKYISVFRLVRRFLLVAREDNLTGISTGLTGRSKNLDLTGNPTGTRRPDRFPSLNHVIAGPDLHRAGPLALWRFSQHLFAKYR